MALVVGKEVRKMRCCDCSLWWQDENENFADCHADPNWPAPCEYEDDYKEENEDENYL